MQLAYGLFYQHLHTQLCITHTKGWQIVFAIKPAINQIIRGIA